MGDTKEMLTTALSEDAAPCAVVSRALQLLDFKAFLFLFWSLTCGSPGRLCVMLRVTFLFGAAGGCLVFIWMQRQVSPCGLVAVF